MRQAHNIRNCDEAKQYPILLVAIKMIFPNFFQIDFENIKVPFLLLIEVKLIINLFGKCELESCSIKSRSEGFTAYIFRTLQHQSIKSAPRSGPKPSSLPSSALSSLSVSDTLLFVAVPATPAGFTPKTLAIR